MAQLLVQPPELTMAAGTEALLQAQANDAKGAPVGGAELVYASLAPEMLQVSRHGVVVSSGRTTEDAQILVTSGDLSVRVRVRVVPGTPARIELTAPGSAAAEQSATLREAGSVQVFDSFGNAVPGVDLEVLLDGAALGTAPKTDAQGRSEIPPVQVASEPASAHRLQVRLSSDPTIQARLDLLPPVLVEGENSGEKESVTD